jgi:pyruvate ferredoxin oxidoreductase delta subunit
MAKYEPKEVDITIAVDDTLCKGVESWAWYGLQPVNRLLKSGGTLIVTSREKPETIIEMSHRKEYPYQLAIMKGTVSFSGLWAYKDDHTDVRILGMISRILPDLFSLKSVQKVIMDAWKDPIKAQSAAKAFEHTTSVTVRPDQGNPEAPYKFDLPKWHEMGEGIAIPSIPAGGAFEDPGTHALGGFRPDRNPTFKKYTTRTMRPVINFDTCIKCTLCWLQCPDSCFDVTPDNLYDANMVACCGCGVCEAVCPVKECVTMVNETEFGDNASQWEMWKKDKKEYETWLQSKIAGRRERSHGFRYRGQYEEQIPEMLNIAREG